MIQLRRSEKGLTNIVILAIALPVLALIISAAVDVIRFPIVKQQIGSAIHNAANTVSVNSGRSWCTLIDQNHPLSECKRCKRCTDTKCDCSGAENSKLMQESLSIGAEQIIKELSKSTTGFLSHDLEDLAVVAATYNVIVKANNRSKSLRAGDPIGLEVLARFDSREIDTKLEYNFDIDSWLEKRIFKKRTFPLGSMLTHDAGASVQYIGNTVTVFSVAVRVKHVFGFSDKLNVGVEELSDKDTSVLASTIIIPHNSNYELDGPLKSLKK